MTVHVMRRSEAKTKTTNPKITPSGYYQNNPPPDKGVSPDGIEPSLYAYQANTLPFKLWAHANKKINLKTHYSPKKPNRAREFKIQESKRLVGTSGICKERIAVWT